MTKDEPVACSLNASDMGQRLAEIAEVGSESLIGRSSDGGSHELRFRADAGTRRRLEAIVAAEAECCSFLGLSLSKRGDVLTLSIKAPEGAREVADGLAAAFGGGPLPGPGRM
jgi:hypothetical protein